MGSFSKEINGKPLEPLVDAPEVYNNYNKSGQKYTVTVDVKNTKTPKRQEREKKGANTQQMVKKGNKWQKDNVKKGKIIESKEYFEQENQSVNSEDLTSENRAAYGSSSKYLGVD